MTRAREEPSDVSMRVDLADSFYTAAFRCDYTAMPYIMTPARPIKWSTGEPEQPCDDAGLV